MALTTAIDQAKALTATMSLDDLNALQKHIEERARVVGARRDPYIATKVFAIPELLETILLHLHFTEIFAVMRVDRTFNATVPSSVKLRRKILTAHCDSLNLEGNKYICAPDSESLPAYNLLIEPALEALGFVQGSARYLAGNNERDDAELLEIAYTNNHIIIEKWLGKATNWCPNSEPAREFGGSKKGKTGSWATTYLTAYPMRVKVGFSRDDDYFAYDEDTVCYYLEPEEANMGRLYDIGVKARQVLEKKADPAAVQTPDASS